MTDKDNWDTHIIEPYVSEYIKALTNRKAGEEYLWEDVCLESFALILWKLQEEYRLDYETAFRLADFSWRAVSSGRKTHMFGKDGHILDREMEELLKAHPEVWEMEKKLPKRNQCEIRPGDDPAWGEGSIFD